MASNSEISAWDMVLTGGYDEAVAKYDKMHRDRPATFNQLAERASALLCLGRFGEALQGFLSAQAVADLDRHRNNQALYLEHIAVCRWLMGDKEGATSALREKIVGIRNKTIRFTDLVGGARPGLLLWFAGVWNSNKHATDEATAFLRQLKPKEQLEFWPAPLACLALGELRAADVFEMIIPEVRTFDEALHLAAKKLGKREELCQTVFYEAIKARAAAEDSKSFLAMSRAASVDLLPTCHEWHLAKHESASRSLH